MEQLTKMDIVHIFKSETGCCREEQTICTDYTDYCLLKNKSIYLIKQCFHLCYERKIFLQKPDI